MDVVPPLVDIRSLLSQENASQAAPLLRPETPRVHVELMRLHHVRGLKRKLKAFCTKHDAKLTNAVYERWQFVQARRQSNSALVTPSDPLIPATQDITGLREELEFLKIPTTAIEEFAEGFLRATSKGLLAVGREQAVDTPPRKVQVSVQPKEEEKLQQVILSWGKAKATLNVLHLAKLFVLYNQTKVRLAAAPAAAAPVTTDAINSKQKGGFSINIGDAASTAPTAAVSLEDSVVAAAKAKIAQRMAARQSAVEASKASVHAAVDYDRVPMSLVLGDAQFLRAAMALCLRYDALAGGGFQAACPREVFQVLREQLGVDMECFASPMNCTWSRFASAFSDLDAHFGSVGSFFDFQPRQGSFEANPPFVPELMDAMTGHIEMLLAGTAKPLSFCVVIPAWSHTDGWRQLNGSSFRRAHVLLSQKEHGYTEGSQQWRKGKFRISTCDTSVFVLQNAAGMAKWPIPPGFEGALRAAFVSKHETIAQRKVRRAVLEALEADSASDGGEEGDEDMAAALGAVDSDSEGEEQEVEEEAAAAPAAAAASGGDLEGAVEVHGGVKRPREEAAAPAAAPGAPPGAAADATKAKRKRKKSSGKKKPKPKASVRTSSNFAALMAKGKSKSG